MAKRHGPRTPVVLIVLDGWGFRPGQMGNAIELGRTPTWHRLWAKAPRTLLNASGLSVGLPEGQIGNSEVGHLNLGAGRVVPQDIVRISQAIDSGAFFHIPALVEPGGERRRTGRTLHLLGLIGNGGVHALDHHLVAAVMLGPRHERPQPIHAWLDGRDTAPQSALAFMQELVDLLGQHGGRAMISTIVGRYYAMDRDKRWERTRVAYDAMVHGVGEPAPDPVSAVRQAYEAGETDEFVKPRIVAGTPRIRDGDGVFCVNFRADRMRQIVRALALEGFDAFDTGRRPRVQLATMTQYDETLPFPVAFGPAVLSRVVAQVVPDHGNCELMIDPSTDGPHTAHTTNPVPLLIVGDAAKGPLRHGAALCDVGPTLLRMFDVELPQEMTGRDLREVG